MPFIKAVNFMCCGCRIINYLTFTQILNLKKSPRCNNCKKSLLGFFSKPFKNLDSSSYTHKKDNESLETLKKIPGVGNILRILIKHSLELETRLHHQANFIRVNHTQLKKLWEQFKYAHNRLGMTNSPELYVYQNPTPNACTFGVEKSFVAISTGCLDLLAENEVLAVLSHELGHIQLDHVLYKSIYRLLTSAAGSIAQATFGLGNIMLYPIQMALKNWDRLAELSSDRAALLVVNNPIIVLSMLMKFAGGTKKFREDLNVESFIAQAESFNRMKAEGPLGEYLTLFSVLFKSHPDPIWRAKELLRWTFSGNFLEILDGEYLKIVG